MTPHRAMSRTGAFTLVETVACILIFGIIGALTAPFISTAARGYSDASTRADLAAEVDAAMSLIVSRVRDIPLKSGQSTAKPDITSISSTSIVWSTGSTIDLSGTTLRYTPGTGQSARTLLTGVSAFSISAHDQSDSALASSLSGSACDSVRRLVITITATRSGVSETQRTRVFLRCMCSGAGV